jgi:hypothetical protein
MDTLQLAQSILSKIIYNENVEISVEEKNNIVTLVREALEKNGTVKVKDQGSYNTIELEVSYNNFPDVSNYNPFPGPPGKYSGMGYQGVQPGIGSPLPQPLQPTTSVYVRNFYVVKTTNQSN